MSEKGHQRACRDVRVTSLYSNKQTLMTGSRRAVGAKRYLKEALLACRQQFDPFLGMRQ
jgi:hypothetical protein